MDSSKAFVYIHNNIDCWGHNPEFNTVRLWRHICQKNNDKKVKIYILKSKWKIWIFVCKPNFYIIFVYIFSRESLTYSHYIIDISIFTNFCRFYVKNNQANPLSLSCSVPPYTVIILTNLVLYIACANATHICTYLHTCHATFTPIVYIERQGFGSVISDQYSYFRETITYIMTKYHRQS